MTYELTVHPFRMGTDKEVAVKVLEEASEVRAEWQTYERMTKNERLQAEWERECNDEQRDVLADELADVIQAACNLADRYDIDLSAAMERCEQRNRDRGRYDSELTPTHTKTDEQWTAALMESQERWRWRYE